MHSEGLKYSIVCACFKTNCIIISFYPIFVLIDNTAFLWSPFRFSRGTVQVQNVCERLSKVMDSVRSVHAYFRVEITLKKMKTIKM